MRRFLSDFLKILKVHRRTLKRFLVVCVLGFIALSGTGYYLSSQSWFCNSCHYMKPYVANWKASSHSDIECNVCHFSKNPIILAKQKTHAMATTIRYFMGTYDVIPRAEVNDEACLQSGCHETRLLKGTAEYKKGIIFDHKDHLSEDRRGMKLRCTSCHSQMVQGDHIAVTESVCFTCHFRHTKPGEPLAGCGNCHGAPKATVVHKGFTLDHAKYIEQGATCSDCHLKVTRGDGDVPRERCFSCHMERNRDDHDKEELHLTHVTRHKVECFECHEEIQHGLVELTHSIDITCDQCHGKPHLAPRDVFAGTGAVGVPDDPSTMFLSKVGCGSCHPASSGPLSVSAVDTAKVQKECVRCHGAGYDEMLTEWQAVAQDGFDLVEPLLVQLENEMKQAKELPPGRRKQLEKAAKEAAANLAIIEDGHAVHNMQYAVTVFESTQKNLAAALKLLKPERDLTSIRPFIHKNDAIRSCIKTCHLGFGRSTTVSFEQKAFPHDKHLGKKDLDCARCHQNKPSHGVVTIKKEDCGSCHHKADDEECSGCHQLQFLVVAGKGDGRILPTHAHKESKMSEDVPCVACHAEASKNGGAPKPTAEACDECHDKGIGKTSTALWQGTTRKLSRKTLARLDSLRSGTPALDSRARTATEKAAALLNAIRDDGSWGVHNPRITDIMLLEANGLINEAVELMKKSARKSDGEKK